MAYLLQQGGGKILQQDSGGILLGAGENPTQYQQNVFLSFADPDGNVQLVNGDTSDNGTPIYYELETQELNFGNRGHIKKIADKIAVLTDFGIDGVIEASTGDSYKPIPMSLSNRVNFGKNINLEGNYFTFKWSGYTSLVSPIFEGFVLEGITDMGMTKQ